MISPSLRRSLIIPAAVIAFLLLRSPATADEIQLQNGDRFTGTVVTLLRGVLTFRTPHGTLAIPWTEVAALTSTQTLLVTLRGAPAAERPAGALPLTDVTAIRVPAPPLVVDGTANAGLIASGGNTDVNSLRLDAELVARARANRFTLTGAVNRAQDRGLNTAESWNAGANYDRFLTDRLFLSANSLFAHDAFRDIQLRTAVGAGVGYQLTDTAAVRLTANAGFGYVDEDREGTPGEAYSAVRESVKLDLSVLGPRVQLFHNHDGYFGVTGDDNLFVHTQNGIRIGLAAGLVTTLQLDLDFDPSPAPGRQQTDRTLALTFGYRF